MIRQPIVCVLGHVDHGKTTLLDTIRRSGVAGKESGGITQHVSASEVPAFAIRMLAGDLLEKMKIVLTLPGLLFIDTPGHEAFVNLRKRGGSIADIAILVIDINQGMQNQTREAIGILKEYKTPFIVAATKIDAMSGWKNSNKESFSEALKLQRNDVQENLDIKIYELVGQLSDFGFSAERFDRVSDFTKQIAIVPVSARTSEGISEVLLFVSGLAQRFLEKELENSEEELTRGAILEVKDEKGLGRTLDVIIYKGSLEEGDLITFLKIDGNIAKSKVKAILKPSSEERETKFRKVEKAVAAAGVKIACDFADEALVGSSFLEYRQKNAAETELELKNEIREIEVASEDDGVIIKADALGSLEAIVKLFHAEKIPIRTASIGKVLKKDVMESGSVGKKDKLLGVIFAFHSQIDSEVRALAEFEGIKIFDEKIIYNLILNYKEWKDKLLSAERKTAFSTLTLPAKVFLMPNHCFRVSNPAVFGVQIMEGRIRKENRLMDDKGEYVGEIQGIQAEKEAVEEAKKGQEVAISMAGVTYGRQVKEKQVLYTDIHEEEIEIIEKKYLQSLTEGEKEILQEIKKLKGLISFSF
ncbi:translation initiation factor IF-2 [Candidatus Micrarchaeota archaeon]|nr:translation initiation factor IF-2 [Candidatus Micrarchaeota archaeon]